ncbi:WW domain-containing protein [Lachnellula occidentalis]|uniref:WW domain-containing protein n=1 Tax=Lachnellula occidentalis TaxID=215460 RepID=A0A8H8RS95_9HELO|nr:WW domain-containing protein [Lachnellula occidentalis]
MAENAEQSPASGKPRDESPRQDTDAPEQSSTAIEPKELPHTDLEDGEYEESDKDEPDKQDNTNAPPLPDEAPLCPRKPLPQTTAGRPSGKRLQRPSTSTTASRTQHNGLIRATTLPPPPGLSPAPAPETSQSPPPPAELVTPGYNPAIHGDYDPTAWYAQPAAPPPSALQDPNSADPYAATAAFNRFTGRFQAPEISTENYNDENKSKRQMNAFFDVDAAANSHDGKSLKAERSGKKLSKTELKTFKEKRKAKKEEKRRAWLRD